MRCPERDVLGKRSSGRCLSRDILREVSSERRSQRHVFGRMPREMLPIKMLGGSGDVWSYTDVREAWWIRLLTKRPRACTALEQADRRQRPRSHTGLRKELSILINSTASLSRILGVSSPATGDSAFPRSRPQVCATA
jgi:hypothetical protein